MRFECVRMVFSDMNSISAMAGPRIAAHDQLTQRSTVQAVQLAQAPATLRHAVDRLRRGGRIGGRLSGIAGAHRLRHGDLGRRLLCGAFGVSMRNSRRFVWSLPTLRPTSAMSSITYSATSATNDSCSTPSTAALPDA